MREFLRLMFNIIGAATAMEHMKLPKTRAVKMIRTTPIISKANRRIRKKSQITIIPASLLRQNIMKATEMIFSEMTMIFSDFTENTKNTEDIQSRSRNSDLYVR